jgi:hypothetical protein
MLGHGQILLGERKLQTIKVVSNALQVEYAINGFGCRG